MSFQQYLVDSSINFTKHHKFTIILGTFGLCGGLISFLMYLGFDSLLYPIQENLIGLLGTEQLTKVFVTEQNIDNVGIVSALELYGAKLVNEFLGADLVPYIFMGYATVTLVYIGQIFIKYNTKIYF